MKELSSLDLLSSHAAKTVIVAVIDIKPDVIRTGRQPKEEDEPDGVIVDENPTEE